MKKNMKLVSLSIAAASILLVGCGSDSNSSKAVNTVEGVVSDGLISGATVKLMDGNTTVSTTTTDENGKFGFTDAIDSSKSYTILATGGTDTDTDEDFTGVNLKAPLGMFEDNKKESVISPLTSLVAEEMMAGNDIDTALSNIATKLDLNSTELKTAPHTTLKLQKKAMKLSLMAKEGIAFSTIREGLDNTGGIDDTDIEAISSDVAIRTKLKDANSDLDGATDLTNIQAVYKKKRIIREIIANEDLNTSATNIFDNVKALANEWHDDNVTNQDITSSFIGTDINFSVATSSFNASNHKVKRVSKSTTFTNSLNTLYYEIENPKTNNQQLLAFDYANDKAHVINTNVILKDKVFIYGGVKDGTKEKYTEKKYGLYLDPNQANEARIGYSRGKPYTYNFFSDNALMKFDPAQPTQSSYVYKSSDIPQDLQDMNITKINNTYEVFENIIDPDNSYIVLDGRDSLVDTIKKESDSGKKQVKITVRVADGKGVVGNTVSIIKNSSTSVTDGVLVSYSAPFIPSDSNGTYELKKYNKTLTSSSKIADGEFYLAGSNDGYIYLFKEGSDKIWAFNKSDDSLSEVTDVTLAGSYVNSTHNNAAKHGGDILINGAANTLSGSIKTLSDGTNTYIAFHYDLHDKITNLKSFGSKGAYKSAQVFKISATSGTKIYDNGDGTDESLDNAVNSDPDNGNINLIALGGDKLYIETGWYDGNSTIGGSCTETITSKGKDYSKCVHVKYGYIDTTTATAVDDTTPMTYNDSNDSLDLTKIESPNLEYFVSRRVGPFAANGKLYISVFAGGSFYTGYKYDQFVFDLGETESITKKSGRTYLMKSADSTDGNFGGTSIYWNESNDKVYASSTTDQEIADTSGLNGGNGGSSISGNTSGAPIAGFGTIGMLKNNKGSHNFELFTVDSEATSDSYKSIDLAPFGGWIYE